MYMNAPDGNKGSTPVWFVDIYLLHWFIFHTIYRLKHPDFTYQVSPATMTRFTSLIILILTTHLCVHAYASHLSLLDRFAIYEQLALHQSYIDNPPDCIYAEKYANLYWPEASFTVIDPDRETTFTGPKELRANYDYAHTVFPLYQWAHSVPVWEISESRTSNQAKVHWRWRVDWRSNTTGVVSTGTYDDVFEKRDGTWKCLKRVSRDDPNWPLYLFAPYSANENSTFRSSCPQDR